MTRESLSRDLPASFVVFLVALPLSMGIALASGAPILSGLIAAVLGGVVVGALSGVPLQVSGPAAGLAVIVFGYIEQFGLPVLGAIIALAGLLQIGLGAARIARVALAISPAVVHGMLAGIGIQIALAQLHVVLGDAPESSAIKNILALPHQVAHMHNGATAVGIASIALVVLWPMLPSAALKRVPAPLVAVGACTLAAAALRLNVPRVELPGNPLSAFHAPALPSQYGAAVLAAVTLAVVASAESLLSAVATDKLHDGPRADLDRELIAQGVGNVTSGLLGGLPITGVIVRSRANIDAGGQTRASTMLHGLWVLFFVGALSGVIAMIPKAALAGLLVVVGARLVSPTHIREMIRTEQWPVYAVTLLGVVGINLLAGIGLGVTLAVVTLLRRLTRVEVSTEARDGKVHVVIEGSLTFVGVPKVTSALAAIPPGRHVDIDLVVDVIDHAAFEALHEWRGGYERTGGSVDMDQLHEAWSPKQDTAYEDPAAEMLPVQVAKA
ncbi:MAG: SulP family inorganic anion transporter [Polyangiales bacterium]